MGAKTKPDLPNKLEMIMQRRFQKIVEVEVAKKITVGNKTEEDSFRK